MISSGSRSSASRIGEVVVVAHRLAAGNVGPLKFLAKNELHNHITCSVSKSPADLHARIPQAIDRFM